MTQRLLLLMLAFLSAPTIYVFGQTRMDSLITEVMSLGAVAGADRLKAFENEEYDSSSDSVKCDFLYLKGLYFKRQKNMGKAVGYYRRSALMADSMRYYDPSFFDSVLKVMLWDKDNGQSNDAIAVGEMSIRAPKEKQQAYPHQYLTYISLANAMNTTFKFADVPKVAVDGMYYVSRQLNPQKDEYYQLPICEAVAWCMIGQTSRADSVRLWIDRHAVSKSEELANALHTLQSIIESHKVDGTNQWKRRALQDLGKIERGLLLANPATSRGSDIFHSYFETVRHTLAFFYFDANSVDDEKIWNRLLANQMIYFFICCDSLPGREQEAYNNAIVRKDFLGYHIGKQNRRLTKWQDIRDNLHEDEASIEICNLPEEVLVLRKEYSQPHSIRIDSLLFRQIVEGLKDEPLAIDSLYSLGGPLAKLWTLISPELEGVRTLFVSGANAFAQINYGAIPLCDGNVVSDRYELHTLLSTSDAGLTSHSLSSFRDAAVFGGVDYENAEYGDSPNQYADEPWQLTRGLPEDIRSGFHNLPGSEKEVADLDSIMSAKGITHFLRKGHEATEESFKALDGKAPDLLHISTHGFMLAPLFSSGDTVRFDTAVAKYKTILSQSGLLFAGANKAWRDLKHGEHNDGILTSREITQLDLSRCKLAVLSACRSALGETRNLTGLPFGVAYALKLAGVKQVLCSLWSIKDDATAAFMKTFYEHLFTVGDAREALRMTQKDMMSSREYSSPYYWASFVIVE